MAWRLEAQLRFAQGRLDDAAAAIARARSIAGPLLADARADTWARHDAALALVLAGRLAQARGQADEAALCWQEATAVLGTDPAGSRDWRVLEPAALAATLAGRTDEARTLTQRLQTFGYVPPDPLTAATLGLADQTETSTTTEKQPPP
jgi:tetratricopeptide (TPR) repeat protein